MRVITARKIVEQQPKLPSRALGGTFSARKPSGGKHVEALSDRREVAQIVALGFDLTEEGATLGSAQHVEKGVLRQPEPADLAAPIVIHGTEGWPGPSKLAQSLDETPNGSSSPQSLDMVLELFGQVTQQRVTVDLTPQPEEGFTLNNGVDLKGVARDAHSHEGPELHPFVALWADRSLERMIVGGLDRARWGLYVGTCGAHAGRERSRVAGLSKHGRGEASDAWETDSGSLDTSIGGGSEVERG